MQFSLLKWPTGLDVPNRIPLSRGVPNAAAMAVDTGGMPRSLPLPEPVRQTPMDPGAAAEPYQALARFAAYGGKVAGDTLNIVMEAEARKREANNLAVTAKLYTDTAMAVDKDLEQLKATTTHDTLRPGFNEMWKVRTQDAVAHAPNADVARALSIKLLGLQVAKTGEVNDAVRKKFVNYHEATLEQTSRDTVKLITDPNTTEADRDYHINELETMYHRYAKTGIIEPDRIVAVRNRTLTSAYNTLARQDLIKNPEAFLPPDDALNPDGGSGSQVYASSGKYPADGKFLENLVDTVGPRLMQERANHKRLASERVQKQFDGAMADAVTNGYNNLYLDLTSGDPEKVGPAASQVDAFIRRWGSNLKDERVKTLVDLSRNPSIRGGTTDDETWNDLNLRLHANPNSVSEDEILAARRAGRLATSGTAADPRSATALLDKKRNLMKSDDVSQRPDYTMGKSLISSALGGSGLTDGIAAMVQLMKPEDAARHRYLYSKALEEFDRRARSKEWTDKNLRELGALVRDEYRGLIFESFPDPLKPPTAPTGSSPSSQIDKGTRNQPPTSKPNEKSAPASNWNWFLPNWATPSVEGN